MASKGNCVIALGNFDGVHKGHQKLILAAKEIAVQRQIPLYAYLFDPHPATILQADRAIHLLTTGKERENLLLHFGVDRCIYRHFDMETAAILPEKFISDLKEEYDPAAVVCGFNYTFGRFGKGNALMLEQLGSRLNFDVRTIGEVLENGKTVSSTSIRKYISDGEICEANSMLGYRYCMAGKVIHGKQIGRKIGFPTANVEIDSEKVIPKFGVYAAYLNHGDAQYPAVVNIGRHPTFPEGGVTMEAHLFQENVELYGKSVTLEFVKYLRPEKKFESADEIEAQILADCREAQMLL